jgi:hypothetical protein
MGRSCRNYAPRLDASPDLAKKNFGVDVHSILEETDCIRVQYRSPSWQTRFDIEQKYDAQSFAFIVLPKSQKTIVFDEDVQHLLGESPIWEERAKLPALDKK